MPPAAVIPPLPRQQIAYDLLSGVVFLFFFLYLVETARTALRAHSKYIIARYSALLIQYMAFSMPYYVAFTAHSKDGLPVLVTDWPNSSASSVKHAIHHNVFDVGMKND